MTKTVKAIKGTKPATVKGSLIKYAPVQAARPGSGTALASYTSAWLALSGMDDGRAVPVKVLKQIAGDTAVAYHTRNGNLEKTPDGVKLTEAGFAHFGNMGGQNRNIRPDAEMVKGYAEMFTTGKGGDLIKNPALIKPIV